jgi:hypothetical protein
MTFYDFLGVPPAASSAQIEAAINLRLQLAQGEERALCLAAREALLDPISRESYNRLHGLISNPTADQRAAQMRADLAQIQDATLRRTERRDAEVRFSLLVTLAVLMLTLWVVALERGIPLLHRDVARLLELRAWESHTDLVSGILITLPLALLAWMAFDILFKALLSWLGRMLIMGAMVSLTSWLVVVNFGLRPGIIFFIGQMGFNVLTNGYWDARKARNDSYKTSIYPRKTRR